MQQKTAVDLGADVVPGLLPANSALRALRAAGHAGAGRFVRLKLGPRICRKAFVASLVAAGVVIGLLAYLSILLQIALPDAGPFIGCRTLYCWRSPGCCPRGGVCAKVDPGDSLYRDYSGVPFLCRVHEAV